MQQMRHRLSPTLVPLVAAALLAAIGFVAAGQLAQGATQSARTVDLRKTKLGMVLVDSRGHTVYLFAKDRNRRSACTASCASFWPPLLTPGKPTAGTGVKASMLGTTKRSDGKLQVTYNRHPLYTFLLDKQAGQTKGEGNLAFGARWYAVCARGTAIVKAAPGTTTTTTGTTTTAPYGGGYG
jgi:predicted lipoprotein with Yx(FWY)xxD motif